MRSIRGVVGRLEWGYFTAGAINGYAVSPQSDGTWALRGTLVNCDAFKIRQRPLIFVAPHAHGEWRWPVTQLEIGEGHGPRALQGTLGPQLPEMIAAR